MISPSQQHRLVRQSFSMESSSGLLEQHSHAIKVHLHRFTCEFEPIHVEFQKRNTTEELIEMVLKQIGWTGNIAEYELCEIMGTTDGGICKEVRIHVNFQKFI